MRIVFLLPSAGQKISGGFKVVYEYADGLARRGHKVTVVHPANGQADASLARRIWRRARWVQRRADGGWKPGWFGPFAPGASLLWVPSLAPRYLPDCDLLVCSSWQTAEWMSRASRKSRAAAYLIHDYEHYMAAGEAIRARIAATFAQVGLARVVTSPAGEELLAAAGLARDFYIPNAIDRAVYAEGSQDSLRGGIGFPARREAFKGTRDAIAALEIVRASAGPGYRYWCFGDYDGPMPEWIVRLPHPSDAELADEYRSSLVFVTASHYEGWGLPGSEAMACGAALVSTDHGGVRAYAVHGESALLSPIKDPGALAANILALLTDEGLRRRIARAGVESMSRFSWDNSIGLFVAMAEELVSGSGKAI